MNIQTVKVTIDNELGSFTKETQLDTEPEMLKWVANQFAEVNSAQVTITDMDGNILATAGDVHQ